MCLNINIIFIRTSLSTNDSRTSIELFKDKELELGL